MCYRALQIRNTFLLAGLLCGVSTGHAQQSTASPPEEFGQLHDVGDIRQSLEGLDANDVDYLHRQRKKFASMSVRERQAMRELHMAISQSAEPDRLFGILQRYRDWLARLPANEREQILSLPPDERIAAIKAKLSEANMLGDMVQLPPEDERVFVVWLGEFLKDNEDAILELLPPVAQLKLGNMRASRPRTMLMATLLFETQTDLSGLPPSAKNSVDQLADRLSKAGQRQFQEAKDNGQVRELLRSWMVSIRARHGAVNISRERMEQFFRNELTATERGYLESLPPPQMEQQLRRMFMERRLGQWNRSNRPGARRDRP